MKSLHVLNVLGGALAALVLLGGAAEPPSPGPEGPQFDAGGNLLFPAAYRDWAFLSSGLDMSYIAGPAAANNRHIFNNTFVPGSAYRAFLQKGTWPQHTIIVIEHRAGATDVSINKRGVVQTPQILGFEAHVKDAARFKGGWGFFSFGEGDKSAELIAYSADKDSCYGCHLAHGAVDTTFVQFYPTLLPVAAKLGTLNPDYVKETGTKVK
ncbi:MAG: cytochrome P460 family protein [Alphaproteobacteria bacterium]|nr:cytochrome P460 family protein [Alphaproteobacteria bacterium]MBV9694474.1 cytochrome P460 family protein [Alphaproteobacteria bacterium]